MSNIKQQMTIAKNKFSDLMAMIYAMSLNEWGNPLFYAGKSQRGRETIVKTFLNLNFSKTLDTNFDELFIKDTGDLPTYALSYNEGLEKTKKRLLSALTDAAYNGISKKQPLEKILEQLSKKFDVATKGLPSITKLYEDRKANHEAFEELVNDGVTMFAVTSGECGACGGGGPFTADEVRSIGFPPFHINCGCSVESWTEDRAKGEQEKPDTPLYNYTEIMVKNINEVDPKFDITTKNFKEAYEKNKSVYEDLSSKTGEPSELIAIIHYRENTSDFLTGTFNVYLHNGEELGNPTKLVPKGKVFDNFADASIDALKDKQTYIDKYKLTSDSKDIVAMMAFAEVYNGLGYYNNNHVSPYLYSGTNLYTSGKYVEVPNGKGGYMSVYKGDVVDNQVGAYLLLKSIINQ